MAGLFRLLICAWLLVLPATAAVAGDLPDEPEEEDALFPRLDVYFPEGKLDLRLSRLIKNALFEGQIKYRFLEGDISAFLRYRYYSYRTIYQFGVFDAVEFERVENLDNDFERVRGSLFLMSWPHGVHRRTFLLSEVDRLSSSKDELRFDNNQTNTFLRLGFQLGTGDDPRLNAIVGETRARREDLFTAHRTIGPSQAAFAAALSWGFDLIGGDFDYTKLELEGLKRLDLGPRIFLVGRAHVGTFLDKQQVRDGDGLEEADLYSIPRAELFRLDGREYLKGLGEKRLGTDQLHATLELFLPWFLDRSHRFVGVDWQNFYWVVYAGVGTAGFDPDVYGRLEDYVPDAGLGFEASFKLKGYTFFLSTLAAEALKESDGVELHVTIKSYH